jgi:hypothetical protein
VAKSFIFEISYEKVFTLVSFSLQQEFGGNLSRLDTKNHSLKKTNKNTLHSLMTVFYSITLQRSIPKKVQNYFLF